MSGSKPDHRYVMVDVRPGYVIVEHEVFSKQMRSYFSAESVPPVEDYREGSQVWKFSGMAQSFQFDLRDCATGQVTKYEKIWMYVAITHRPIETTRHAAWLEKLRLLNRYFGERLETPNKKILILPDYFGLYREFSHGQILADFGLTALDG
jgi:hypothetical protein